jgi:hypothetical protein
MLSVYVCRYRWNGPYGPGYVTETWHSDEWNQWTLDEEFTGDSGNVVNIGTQRPLPVDGCVWRVVSLSKNGNLFAKLTDPYRYLFNPRTGMYEHGGATGVWSRWETHIVNSKTPFYSRIMPLKHNPVGAPLECGWLPAGTRLRVLELSIPDVEPPPRRLNEQYYFSRIQAPGTCNPALRQEDLNFWNVFVLREHLHPL